MSSTEVGIPEWADDPDEGGADASVVAMLPAPPPPLGERRTEDDADAEPGRAPGRAPLSTGFVVAVSALATVSVLALWAAVFALVLSPVQEHRSQHVLHATLREQFALQTSPIGGTIAAGAPIGSIDIPTAGVHDLVFIEGTTSGELEQGPGHRRDSPLPGQPGVSVLMGRSVLFGAPFGRVARLRAGDVISVTTGQGTFTYQVDGVRRAGDPVPAAPTGDGGSLILVTSEAAPGAGGRWTRQAVFVDATLRSPSQPATGDRPTVLTAAETPMSGNPSALTALVGWLLALVVAAVALAWSRARWGRTQSLLVGIPVVVALAWLITQTASQLLPNLH